MSSLINPQCGVPTFIQTDPKLVGDCGKYSGYIIAIIITIILLFLMLSVWVSSVHAIGPLMSQEDQDGIKRLRNSKLLVLFLFIVLVWIFVPKMFSFFSVRSWESYQSQISQYMAQGLSRQDAINKIQSLYQSELQASAIIDAGAEIASSRNSY